MKTVIRKVIKKEDLNYELKEFGRFTVVSMTTPHGLNGIGISRKNEEDNYSKKTGEEIAYGRALGAILKKLNKEKIHNVLMG